MFGNRPAKVEFKTNQLMAAKLVINLRIDRLCGPLSCGMSNPDCLGRTLRPREHPVRKGDPSARHAVQTCSFQVIAAASSATLSGGGDRRLGANHGAYPFDLA